MTYIVTLKYQHPAWDEQDGIEIEVQAASKKDAIKAARWKANRNGYNNANQGRMTFSAKEAGE